MCGGRSGGGSWLGAGPVPPLRLSSDGGGGGVWVMPVTGVGAWGAVPRRSGVLVGVWMVLCFAVCLCNLRDVVWSAGHAGCG